VPVEFITEASPPIVHLSDSYGVVVSIENPRLSGDTVLGTAMGQNRPVAIPLRQVQRISTVRFNGGRTALLVGGVAAMGALAAYAALANASGNSGYMCDYNEPSQDGSEREKCGFTP
jgi:hypothetical protein